MPRFNPGDRVQLVGDIARYYPSILGTVLSSGEDAASVLSQYNVRLANGAEGVFFDFQLNTPPGVTPRLIVDAPMSPREDSPRLVHLAAGNIEIHFKIHGSSLKTLAGHVTARAAAMRGALVTFWIRDGQSNSVATDNEGEFVLQDVPEG